jgi:hypothetical protein
MLVQLSRSEDSALRLRESSILSPLVSIILGVAWISPAHAEDLPQLQWDQPIRCIRKKGEEVVRVQCENKGGQYRCLVAPNQMTYGGELQEIKDCPTTEEPEAYQKLVASGARMIPAIAETPPGYARSESGRAFQVKFDLLNRVYVGVSWVPTFQRPDARISSPASFPFGRAQAEAGLNISVLSPRGRSRHDMRILEGTATFSDLELRGLLFSYDYQHEHRRPAFWISTFFGKPRVYDVTPAMGWGFRLLNINDRPPAFRNTLDIEYAEAHLSWNPWQSNDMYSHLRIEAGADFGEYWPDRGEIKNGLKTGRLYAGFSSAIRSRFSLGEGGLHYIFLDVNYLRPTVFNGEVSAEAINRVNASLTYEGILIAINDQPLSFRMAAIGSANDDPSTQARNVELRFTAGLRFSFWAPPRVFEPLPELEDP